MIHYMDRQTYTQTEKETDSQRKRCAENAHAHAHAHEQKQTKRKSSLTLTILFAGCILHSNVSLCCVVYPNDTWSNTGWLVRWSHFLSQARYTQTCRYQGMSMQIHACIYAYKYMFICLYVYIYWSTFFLVIGMKKPSPYTLQLYIQSSLVLSINSFYTQACIHVQALRYNHCILGTRHLSATRKCKVLDRFIYTCPVCLLVKASYMLLSNQHMLVGDLFVRSRPLKAGTFRIYLYSCVPNMNRLHLMCNAIRFGCVLLPRSSTPLGSDLVHS